MQKTLVPKAKTPAKKRVANPFNEEKEKLRELHKRLYAGLVMWDDISEKEQELLQRYFGW